MPSPLAKPKRSIGEAIKRHRSRKGWSQTQLGMAIGYTIAGAGSYICRVEQDAQQPLTTTLRRIAKALGVHVRELIS